MDYKLYNFTDSNSIVSIAMLTYNHRDYIEEAIDSVLAQITNFPIQLVIADDFSLDGTREIVLKYQEQYPDKIKLILQNKNVGASRNNISLFENLEGKYVAALEGDDYWTDPYKLQKQVDFLENNEEYGLVHADINSYNQSSQKFTYNANKNQSNTREASTKEELFSRLLEGDYLIRTATVVFRNSLLQAIPPNKIEFLMGDTPLWLDLSQITKFKYFDEVNTVYRVLPESASKSVDQKKLARFRLSIIEMQIYYLKKYNYVIKERFKKKYKRDLFNYQVKFDATYKPYSALFESNLFDHLSYKLIRVKYFRFLLVTLYQFNDFSKNVYRKIRYS